MFLTARDSQMTQYVTRVIIKSLPVIAGAVGAWIAANFTQLHAVFCQGQL